MFLATFIFETFFNPFRQSVLLFWLSLFLCKNYFKSSSVICWFFKDFNINEHDIISKATACLKSNLYFDMICLKDIFLTLRSVLYCRVCLVVDANGSPCNIVSFSISIIIAQFILLFVFESCSYSFNPSFFSPFFGSIW